MSGITALPANHTDVQKNCDTTIDGKILFIQVLPITKVIHPAAYKNKKGAKSPFH
jgi:hypothetical protein